MTEQPAPERPEPEPSAVLLAARQLAAEAADRRTDRRMPARRRQRGV